MQLRIILVLYGLVCICVSLWYGMILYVVVYHYVMVWYGIHAVVYYHYGMVCSCISLWYMMQLHIIIVWYAASCVPLWYGMQLPIIMIWYALAYHYGMVCRCSGCTATISTMLLFSRLRLCPKNCSGVDLQSFLDRCIKCFWRIFDNFSQILDVNCSLIKISCQSNSSQSSDFCNACFVLTRIANTFWQIVVQFEVIFGKQCELKSTWILTSDIFRHHSMCTEYAK